MDRFSRKLRRRNDFLTHHGTFLSAICAFTHHSLSPRNVRNDVQCVPVSRLQLKSITRESRVNQHAGICQCQLTLPSLPIPHTSHHHSPSPTVRNKKSRCSSNGFCLKATVPMQPLRLCNLSSDARGLPAISRSLQSLALLSQLKASDV